MVSIKKQSGVVGIAILVVLFMTIGYVITSYFSYANRGAIMENNLITKQDDNKNTMATYSNKIQEIAKAAKLGVEAQQKLITMANNARYGTDGSKAVMQWIQEQNPNVDTQLYKKLQDTIDSERTRFETEQRIMLDIRKTYQIELDKPYSGFWLKLAGYPKVNLENFEVVINNYTDQAYRTKRAEAIDLQ